MSNAVTVEISNKIVLRGLCEKDVEFIERDLTFKNPQYEKIMKYSKWGSTNEPKFLEYFKIYEEDEEMCAEVPLGYNLNNLYSSIISNLEDYRKTCVVKDFPKFLMTLRETQAEAQQAYIEKNSEPLHLSGSIQLPTGKGKTILGLSIASTLKCRTLIIVHKTDLVTGWQKDIKEAFGGRADVGLIKAQSRKVGKHFTIATIQTLNKLTPKELSVLYDTFGLVIQDEMHHCPSSSFALGNNFNCRYRLGLTATPERTDGLECIMNLYYGSFCYIYQPNLKEDEEDEDILQVDVIIKEVPTYFNPVVYKTGDRYRLKPLNFSGNFDFTYPLKDNETRIRYLPYNQQMDIQHLSLDKAAVMCNKTALFVCTDILKEYKEGHSCIVFFSQKEEVNFFKSTLMEVFNVPESDIGLYYGDNKDCDSVLDKAEKQRKFITLATYSKATEGTNVKQWEVAFLVSSINNGKNVEQAVGRIRRTLKNGTKLETAKLYDYRYNLVYRLDKHGATRDTRYKKLGFNRTTEVTKLFRRGFN